MCSIDRTSVTVPMKITSIKRLSILGLVLVFLVDCSTDPNKQKLKYLNSGAKYVKQNKLQEAVIQFRNAIQIDPRFAEAHYQLARAYLGLKNPEAAYRELMETVTLSPQNSEAQLQLARAYLGLKNPEAAYRELME